MVNFQSATGLKMSHVFAGRHTRRLGEILNLTPAEMTACSYQIESTKPTLVRGEQLRKFDLSRRARRVCPQCLQESAHQQFWWDLLFISHCPIHNVQLVGHCRCGKSLSWGDREIPRCKRCHDGSVLDLPTDAVKSDRRFELWALGRLKVIEPTQKIPMLDDVLLKDAVAIADRVGRLDEVGWAKSWIDSSVTFEDLMRYRESGFAIISDDGLPSLLDRVHRQSEKILDRPPSCMEASLGWFWWWFSHSGGRRFSPELASILTGHFDLKFHVKNKRMNIIAMPRSLMSLKQVSRISGKSYSIVRAALIQRGATKAPSRGSSFAITPDEADWVAENLVDTIEIKEAQAMVGVGWRSWQVLLRRGWLPIVLGPVTYATRRSRSIPFIRRQAVTDWLDAIVDGAPELSECPPSHSTLSGRSRKMTTSFEQLFDRVLDRRVPVVGRLRGQPGLAGVVLRDADFDDLIFRGGGRPRGS
ncbi:TniQ family protein [Devosia sp. A8/3-2]|nr:TniQ family protein [Devosia sp. A8/3-2]